MAESELRSRIEKLVRVAACTQVAVLLRLRGKEREYYCPSCQHDNASGVPFLTVTLRDFNCLNCGVYGNAIDLVRYEKRCDLHEAVDWLSQHFTTDLIEAGPMAGAESRFRPAAAPPPPPVAATPASIYAAFLAGCLPLDEAHVDNLTALGVGEPVIERLHIRRGAPHYLGMMKMLVDDFGAEALLAAGLLVAGAEARDPEARFSLLPAHPHLRPIFLPYHEAGIAYLIVPYLKQGQPVHLKAVPLVDNPEKCELPPSLGTGGAPPCLYNVDAIAAGQDVVLVEGELSLMIALTHGCNAVGVGKWVQFKPVWIDLFNHSNLTVVYFEQEAGHRSLQNIATWFKAGGERLPRWGMVAAGSSLNAYLSEGRLDQAGEEGPLAGRKIGRIGDDPLRGPGPSAPAAPARAPASRPAASPAPAGAPGSAGAGKSKPKSVPAFPAGKPPRQREPEGDPLAPAPVASSSGSSGPSMPGAAAGINSERFIAAVPAGKRRSIVIHHQIHNGEHFVRWRYWYRKRDSEEWYRDEQMNFILPVPALDVFVRALISGGKGKPCTTMPDWLKEHLLQAQAAKRQQRGSSSDRAHLDLSDAD